ncbi:hypothetical protein [Nonomuraea longicatena]|uniref:Phenylacetate-CoA ligase n=1 Tax=Nonomuraea longicatena TaxID=83682 RepID=A0ABP4B432_9ACTN
MPGWLTRDDLASGARAATGLLLVSPDAESVVPRSPADAERVRAALAAAGIGPSDRVVVALAEPAGSLWAGAAAGIGASAASVGPRGRLRLHHALSALGATALVATPTGAMDLLARLHLEFLLDPLDLGLRHLVVTGEIASKRTLSHLAEEFGARVSEVFASPFGGGALGWRAAEDEPFTPLADLALAAPAKDEFTERSGEVVLLGGEPGGETVLRTGFYSRDGLRPAHTVGEHVLVRGVWLALPRLRKALARIDGVSGWELRLSRPGTLDSATLTVVFNREGLVRNPMWKGRVQQAVQALTPVSVTVEIAPEAAESGVLGAVTDLRGHHLGSDRALLG